MEKHSFLKGAFFIAAGGFLSKAIGALYKIPLANLIGGYGLGLYQMAYPFYCLLLTVSATGIPSSIATLAAERRQKNEGTRALFNSALKLFLMVGGVGTLLMACLSPVLSSLQKEELILGYCALAPSVLLTSVISVFRGWFQGRGNMLPTAVSEVVEQIVKVLFGLTFAYVYRENVVKAVSLMLLSVSLSELVAFLFMLLSYERAKRRENMEKDGGRVAFKEILSISFPVTCSSALFPLSSFIDSVLLVRLMGVYEQNAVSLYGLYSGGATTIASLPATVCYGLAAASIPEVGAAAASEELCKNGTLKKRIGYSLFLTFLLSLLGSAFVFLLASPIVNILFKALSVEEKSLMIRLVRLLSVGTVFLACSQTLSACLTSMKKPKYAVLSALVAVGTKIALSWALVAKPNFSVFGAAIALNVCYFVDFLLNLLYNLRVERRLRKGGNKKEKDNDYGCRAWRRVRRFDEAGRGSHFKSGG